MGEPNQSIHVLAPTEPITLEPQEALDILYSVSRESPWYDHAREVAERSLESPSRAPESTPRHKPKYLTIGMATYDDFDGCYFSIQSMQLHHAEILDSVEFIVLDNNPTGRCGRAVKAMEGVNPNLRYITCRSVQSSAVREFILREATGEWVLCLDSHVLFWPGALARLLNYCREHPDSKDLLTGPLLVDDMKGLYTHNEPEWCGPMFGRWSFDCRGQNIDAPAFEIPMSGLGVFACRRAAWPGFNPRFAGYGGEEGYVHEKIRRAGGRNLCLPFLRWLHRAQRPLGIPYAIDVEGKIRNYLLGYDELGIDPAPAIAALEDWEERHGYGREVVRRAVSRINREIQGPFHDFDAIYCVNLDDEPEKWNAARERFYELALDKKVRRFPATDTPLDRQIGRALTHRRIIAEARLLRLESILVFDADFEFSADASDRVAGVLPEIEREGWRVLCLGGQQLAEPPLVGTVPRTNGIGYHSTVYDAILDAIPDNAVDVALWLRKVRGLGQFLAGYVQPSSAVDISKRI
jgi:hypothetical protein